MYRGAAVELGWAFAYSLERREPFTTWDVWRIWPMQVSVEYLGLLGDLHPKDLVFLAYYCILLQQMEPQWHFERRATRLISEARIAIAPLYTMAAGRGSKSGKNT